MEERIKYIIIDKDDGTARMLTEEELQTALREKSYWVEDGSTVYIVSGQGKITSKLTFEEEK